MDNLSYLSNADTGYIESLYQEYKQNPENIDFGWRKFFEGFDLAKSSSIDQAMGENPEHFMKEIKCLNMIHGYRDRGHLFTQTNPVRERRKYFPGKELETFGFTEADLETVFNAGVEVGLGPAKLKDIRQLLEDTYCRSIGAEYMYMRNPRKIKWLQERIERERNTPKFSIDKKKQLLEKINEAVVFENFLGTKFLGQKRFSLEGAESLIPALDSVIEKGSELGIEEFVIGMAHRGRLNVLVNTMQKSYKDIFAEFEGKSYDINSPYSGDVKYHMGYSSDAKLSTGKSVHLSLCPNPSHLETVNPVVEGIVRSKMELKYDSDANRIAPILIHGDAAIAGQGICYEVLQMCKLDGFKTGGTIHIVINNQIGFTTNYKDSRSSTYCTDLAKTTLSPVFHVNGDDVESLVYAVNLAVEYRQKYNNDVFIDLLCYRRFGHNESDEPKFTQPLLYKIIEKHPNPKEIYSQKLQQEGSIDANYSKELESNFKNKLQGFLDEVKAEYKAKTTEELSGTWSNLKIGKEKDMFAKVKTAISKDTLLNIGKKITHLPKDKVFFKKTEKLFEERANMVEKTHTFDWAMGELFAYGSLMQEGHLIRITGQDVKRGTFSHRHAVITLEDSEEQYTPLNNIGAPGKFTIHNSLLSEYGVLGYEYGYAMANPNALTIWEAQFGDFSNGAQIIIDQYISSAETKWQRGNGIVILLPHGYEGQGPEHSSGRMERYLELCADNNMQVVDCTNPANLFHALRRQLKRNFRKPLIVFTPKSLLRHPLCVSTLEDFTKGEFQEVIDDSSVEAKQVKRLLFCTGKVYYDLLEKQKTENRKDVAIIRIEQLYPTPFEQMEKIAQKYSNAKEFFWVQEEPGNMGAWPFICRKFRSNAYIDFDVISRERSGSPATGYSKVHTKQQQNIVNLAFDMQNIPNAQRKNKK